MMKTSPGISKIAAGCLALLLGAGLSNAANVSLTAADAGGTSSLNSAGKWSDGQTPSPANDYFTGAFFVRTPADGSSPTFQGNSLTLQQPSGQGAPMRSILFKGSGGNIYTINNLTNAAGGVLNNGGSGAVAAPTFTGNLWTIAGNSTLLSDQGSTIIGYPLAGSAILTNLSGQSRTITYTGNLSAFTGKFYISSSCTVALNPGSSNLGNPAAFAADQIMIGAGCTLLDNVGLTFNNPNSGITLLKGAGTATINAAGTTIITEPITDITNGVSSASSLTVGGSGTLILNGTNTYSGGTIVSAGTLQLGNALAFPVGNLTDNALVDLNSNSVTVNVLSGAGVVDTVGGGLPTLTVGANGGSGTFSGTIQNSGGTLSVIKSGAGTETFSGAYNVSGTTLVAGGVLALNSAASAGGSTLIASNGAALSVDSSSGNAMVANNLVVGTNSTLNLNLNSAASGINASGGLTLQDNARINLTYGSLTANPSAPAINASGAISAPGANIVISITALGLKTGTFSVIKYTGTALSGISNFQLSPPPGVAAILVNNQGNHSIDVQITSIPNQLSWYGAGGGSWDLATVNWKTGLGVDSLFRQYTNGSVIAGDSVTFDDTLTNDFVNPQPTNITLNTTFFAFPVVVNSTLPYTIAGTGGITGVTSLVKSNSGSLTLLTSNSFSGGFFINDSGAVIITNDSALGASSGPLTINGGTLQMNGPVSNNRTIAMPVASSIGVGTNVTASLGGVISGAAASFNKIDNGTLVLTAKETITGDVFIHGGTLVVDSGGSITNGSYHDVGQNGNDSATLTLSGTGSFGTTSDFNLGDLDNSTGVLNIQGSATLVANQFFVGSANAAGSTASGTVNQSGGTITEVSTAVGAFAIGGRTSTSGVGVYNMSGGTLTANSGIRVGGTGIGTLNQSGGTINAVGGINIARVGLSFGTNNLNGGTLVTFNVASSTGSNAVFNFNGGTLQAAFNPPSAFMSGGIQANVLAGGAVVDSSTNNVTISTPLLTASPNGGLTKKGAGTLTLTGTNTFTGPITNVAGTLSLNSGSIYTGAAFVNAGTLQVTPASTLQGGATVTNGAGLAVNQIGNNTFNMGNLTLNGIATGSGATIGFTPATGNNPTVAMMNCGTLTLTGTNTINLAAVNLGTLALIHYTGSLAGSGNITNLSLPQGATGTISNDVADSTLFAVITSTGPGLVWTGTNSAALNTWNINSTTNWLVGAVPTSYHQIITPGDAVTFNDIGNGTVILNTNVSPSSVTISNSSKVYTFNGSGGISGPAGIQKVGTGTAILNLTNDTYSGATVISNGTLQVATGIGTPLSASADLLIGSSGTLQLSALSANATTTVGEFTGSGLIDYSGGNNSILVFGGNNGGTWNGTIRDHNAGGLSITKNGGGTWIVGGSNYLNNGDFFNAVSQAQLNGGTTIITNGGLLGISFNEFWVAQGAGNTSAVVVAGGTLAVSNNWLAVGRSDPTAVGTLIVNSGTVQKSGNNNIVIGSSGGTGTLIVNGGQVLNTSDLWLGENATGSGTLFLNGGLVQARVVRPNNAPLVSVAYFNGGTLQATTNSTDFLQISSQVMSNGLVLDDGGWAITILTATLQQGDAFSGGLVKKGSGVVYMDSPSSYIGTTVVTNGTLAGIGSVTGPLAVGPAGNLGAGDSGSLGTFTASDTVKLQGKATFRINRDSGPTSDSIIAGGAITYGGTLVISNLSTTTLTTSDTFQLFSAPSHTGNFSNIAGSPGAGLAYSFNPVNGMLSIVTSTIATNPTNITLTVSGGSLTLSWPSDHTGWTLQSNAVSLIDPNQWFDYPPSTGSRDTDTVTIPIGTSGTNVFFRLKYP